MGSGSTKALLILLVLVIQACAGPLAKRAVDSTPTWLIRLDSFRDPAETARGKYDHPVEWSDAALTEVLERIKVIGADEGGRPQPLLSFGELMQIAPGLREAFHRAKPTEWVVFSVIQSKATYRTLTSGALFVKGGKLHLMLANHRVRIPYGRTDVVDPVKAAPLQPLFATNDSLAFDPPQFVVAAEDGWVQAESEKPVSRIAVDYQGFLASQSVSRIVPPVSGVVPAAPAKPAPEAGAPEAESVEPAPTKPAAEAKPPHPPTGKTAKPSPKAKRAPQPASPQPTPAPAAPSSAQQAPPKAASESAGPASKADVKAQLMKLQEEAARLQRMLEEQEGAPITGSTPKPH